MLCHPHTSRSVAGRAVRGETRPRQVWPAHTKVQADCQTAFKILGKQGVTERYASPSVTRAHILPRGTPQFQLADGSDAQLACGTRTADSTPSPEDRHGEGCAPGAGLAVPKTCTGRPDVAPASDVVPKTAGASTGAAAADPALDTTLGLPLSPPSLLAFEANEVAPATVEPNVPANATLPKPEANVDAPPNAKPLAPLLARPPKPPEKGAAEAAGSTFAAAAADCVGVSFSPTHVFAFLLGTSTLSDLAGFAT